MNFYQQAERYKEDPEFRALVEAAYHMLMRENITVSELKGAVVFAAYKFESEHVRPFWIGRDFEKSARP